MCELGTRRQHSGVYLRVAKPPADEVSGLGFISKSEEHWMQNSQINN